MARLKGFEPPTHGLEGRCSIQLSYRRKPRSDFLRHTAQAPLTVAYIITLISFCQALFLKKDQHFADFAAATLVFFVNP